MMKPHFFPQKPPTARDYRHSPAGKWEHRLVKWGIGWALGQAAVIAALVKLL
jgi:hypothetical protein